MLKKEKAITTIVIIFILSCLFGFGCSSYNPRVFGKPSTGERASQYTVWSPNKKVCVLPFENLSSDTDADIRVREIFLTELFAAHLFNDIVDLVEANAALMSLRIRKPNSLDRETIKALGEKLDVGYLILGVVTDYGFGKRKESGAIASLSVRMIDVETGNIIWTANHFKTGTKSIKRILGISEGPMPIELTRAVCAEIVGSLKQNIQTGAYYASSGNANYSGGSRKGGCLFGIFGKDDNKENRNYPNQYQGQQPTPVPQENRLYR